MQTKTCKKCTQNFEITPDDLSFYEKMKVPPPTFCPLCRLKRRMIWRNERTLFKRTCGMCNSSILAAYHPDSPYIVYCGKCWWSDAWDPTTFGREYDFSRPFFEQYSELLKSVPKIALVETNNVDSLYCNYSIGNNRLYYSFASHYNEDSGYLVYSNKLKRSYDNLHVGSSDRTIGSNYCDKLYNSAYLMYAFDCSDCILGYDLRNCTNCIGCVNLRNASHCIFNIQYPKDEYARLRAEILATSRSFEQAYKTFLEFKRNHPVPESYQKKCVQSFGNDLEETKALSNCFSVKYAEDSTYVYVNAVNIKNCMDVNNIAYDAVEFSYECQGMTGSSNMRFCDASWNGDSFVTYGTLCFGSKNLFGCAGVRSGSYEILNREYSKEEYEMLTKKIIDQMNEIPYVDSLGHEYRFGEFFPAELSPFSYNESIASQYFPLTKEEARVQGEQWRDRESVSHTPTFDNSKEYSIENLTENITSEVFACVHGGTCAHQCPAAFKITKDELEIYKQLGIPLPTLCPNCRHYGRLAERGGYELQKKKCSCAGISDTSGNYNNCGIHDHTGLCGQDIVTVFSDELHPIVYCEKCYQKEIV